MTIFSLRKGRTRTGLLEVEDLRVSYPDGKGGEIEALSGVSFKLSGARILALLGRSGSGKTTVIRAVMGLLPTGAVTGGRVVFEGVDMLYGAESDKRRTRGARIGYVGQDSFAAFDPVFTLGYQLDEAVTAHGSPSREARRTAVHAACTRSGLHVDRRLLRSYPHQLSGGMLQRSQIAAALLHSPPLVVADEPTSALDPLLRAGTADLLRSVRDDFRASVLVATHDVGLVEAVADEALVLHEGRVVERGDVGAMFDDPSHPYTAAMIDAHERLSLTSGVGEGEPR